MFERPNRLRNKKSDSEREKPHEQIFNENTESKKGLMPEQGKVLGTQEVDRYDQNNLKTAILKKQAHVAEFITRLRS